MITPLTTFAKQCNCCKKGMNTGYVINVGISPKHYCSEKCLFKNISKDEFAELTDETDICYEPDNAYYNEWDESEHEYILNENGILSEMVEI